jgi:hypothetical protein
MSLVGVRGIIGGTGVGPVFDVVDGRFRVSDFINPNMMDSKSNHRHEDCDRGDGEQGKECGAGSGEHGEAVRSQQSGDSVG